MDPIERVLVALVQIQRSRAHRIVGAWTYVIRNIGKPVLDLRGGNPRRPFFLASDLSYAGPCERLLADCDTVANGLALGQNIIQVPIIRIDHDGTGHLLAAIVDNLALILTGNR